MRCSPPARRSPGIRASSGLPDFFIDTDVIVLSTPEIAGLPYVISGLVAAGGLAAALSTADGLLLAIANALSHDIYYNMIQKVESRAVRNTVIGAIVVVVVGGIFLLLPGPSPVYGIAWRWLLLGRPRRPGGGGLAVLGQSQRGRQAADRGPRPAAAGGGGGGGDGFDQAVGHPRDGGLGVLARHGWQLPGTRHGRLVEAHDHRGRDLRHDRRLRAVPVLPGHDPVLPRLRRQVRRHDVAAQSSDRGAGDLADRHGPSHGGAAGHGDWTAMAGANAHPLANRVGWFNLNNISCGLLGMPFGFLVIIVVSLFTKEPSEEMKAFIDEIRKPRGKTVLEEKTT